MINVLFYILILVIKIAFKLNLKAICYFIDHMNKEFKYEVLRIEFRMINSFGLIHFNLHQPAVFSYLKNFHFGIMASIPNPVKRKRLVTSVYKNVDR